MGTVKYSGPIASFHCPTEAMIRSLKVHFSPKQEGSGTPSPENVREITGYNEIELNYTNEVLFEISSGKYTWIVPECYKGKTILYSGYVDNTNGTKDAKLSFRFYDKENATISTGTSLDYVPIGEKKVINVLFTLTDDINSVIFNMSVSSTAIVGTRQVILSSNIISNKTYYNQNKTIDWSNNIGTIYGGYVDLITGELVQTHAKYIEDGTINTNTWYSLRMSSSLIQVSKSLTYLENLQPKLGYQAGIFNYLASPLSSNSWRGAIGTNANAKNNTSANNDLRIIIASADFPNISDFISYLNEHSLEFVYELETPITYQLTSAQLQTFIGQNNVWSNADYVEVEYDLYETQDILARKQFIIANQPHIESVSGNIANFSTDIIAPIKSAKIYFNPTQEGIGDPSLDNIRPISGWTNINLTHAQKSIVPFLTNSFFSQGKYQSYTGWCDTWKVPDRTKQYIYSVYIDNTSGEQGARAIIWYRNKDNTGFIGADISNTIEIGTSSRASITIDLTQSPDIYYIQFGLAIKNATASNPMVEIGNVNTEYESYNVSNLSLNWQNDIGTIYGGYVDLINGELVETYQYSVLNNPDDWIIHPNISRVYAYDRHIFPIDYSKGNAHGLLCSIAPVAGGNTNYPFICRWYNENEHNYCVLRYASNLKNPPTLEDIKELASNNQIAIAYELANPIHHTLTPQTLKTLKGVNNIWSDANGPISIQYWTH